MENYSPKMTCQILEIIDKISSSARMSHSVNDIVKGFQRSEFFGTVLPDFIDKMTELHEKRLVVLGDLIKLIKVT